jgi:glycosyltransferase involved in cell wall biosynthesis
MINLQQSKRAVFFIPLISYARFPAKRCVDALVDYFKQQGIRSVVMIEPRFFISCLLRFIFRKADASVPALWALLPNKFAYSKIRFLRWMYLFPIRCQLKSLDILDGKSFFMLFKPHQYYLSLFCDNYFVLYYDNYLGQDDDVFVNDLNDKLLKQAKMVCFSSGKLLGLHNNCCNGILMPNAVPDVLVANSSDWMKIRAERFLVKPKRIGLVGVLNDSYDWQLIFKIAEEMPDVEVWLIGRLEMPFDNFKKFKNIKMIGEFQYEKILDYISMIDVGIVPYKLDKFNEFRDPLKIYEYFLYGLPVVSYECDVSREIKELIYMAKDGGEFISLIRMALCEKIDTLPGERRKVLAKGYTWKSVISAVGQEIMEKL